jgi:hypothetical protein
VTAALGQQGFGVLTTIDVRDTLKAKLDVDVEDYTILGACNPPLAHRALSEDPQIGLLLPCNVTVRQASGHIVAQAVDPAQLLALTTPPPIHHGSPELATVARDASTRLSAALDALAAAHGRRQRRCSRNAGRHDGKRRGRGQREDGVIVGVGVAAADRHRARGSRSCGGSSPWS